MRVVKKNNVNIHWWGNTILLIHSLSGVCVCDDVETVFLEYLEKTNSLKEVITTIAQELGLEMEVMNRFADVFLENYKNFFDILGNSSIHSIKISGRKGVFYPLELHISLTSSCVQKCKHCYKSATTIGQYINGPHLEHFLNAMSGYVPYLSLSGGEPTLHPYFCSLMQQFGSRYNIQVLSSGYKLSDDTMYAVAYAQRGLAVSIYSASSEIHDNFTQVPGSYCAIMQTLLKAKSCGIPISVSTMINNHNIDDIEHLSAKLALIPVQNITIGVIAPIGRAKTNRIECNYKLQLAVQERLAQIKMRYSDISIVLPDYINENNLALSPSPFKCMASTLQWSVYENGDIHPCSMYTIPELKMGDIDNYDEILKNHAVYDQRIRTLPYIKNLENPVCNCPFGIE